MTFKSTIRLSFVLCIMAILAVAMCGCDDLGAYEDTDAYYDCFGDIVFISGMTGEVEEYSVEDYFYNDDSRDNFLQGEDGTYEGVEHDAYVYVAIPFEKNIDMDSIALYIQSTADATVYINVFVTELIPSSWRPILGSDIEQGVSDDTSGDETGNTEGEESGEEGEEETYDDPDPNTRVGEITVNLQKDVWNSFILDVFNVNGEERNSIQIEEGQYILLQIRNNSGVRIFDEEKQIYVDPQTGLEISVVDITMTNLLIRSLETTDSDEQQGG